MCPEIGELRRNLSLTGFQNTYRMQPVVPKLWVRPISRAPSRWARTEGWALPTASVSNKALRF